jgi:hypothetical protein
MSTTQRGSMLVSALLGALLLAGCASSPAEAPGSNDATHATKQSETPSPASTSETDGSVPQAPVPEKTAAVDPATAALERARTERDIPPKYMGLESDGAAGDTHVDKSTVRFLGESDVASFWAGYDKAGNICLFTYAPDSFSSGSSCTLVATYASFGLSEQTGDDEGWAEGYLVPDAAIDSLNGLSTVPGSVNNNFVLVDPQMSTADRSAYTALHEGDTGFKLFLYDQPQSEL